MDVLQGDSESDVEFSINEKYAKRYDKWRRGEEIQKIKDKYGDIEDSDSSSFEEEDEDGKELTEDIEKQFFKTLSCLKEKNPKIYDQNVIFFEKKNEDSEEIETHEGKKKKEPSLTIAGYQRKVLLETGGQFSDTEEQKQPFEMMNDEDQENAIKQSFKDVLKDSDSEDNEGNWGNLFMKRVKTEKELNKEEEDYKKWLAGEQEKLKNSQIKEELKGLHDCWSNPELDDGEKFLRDYILNRRYLDKEDKNRIPSYDEVVHDSDSNLSADEVMINKQDEFEKKYNFRFEEPDQEFIKRYPRTLEQSMRKKDERRKKHREEIKQRKQTERSKKDEELKRLKVLKKKEIIDKIKKLQQITGNEDIAFNEEDLEEDFDPEKHDKRMSQIFNEDYYDIGNDEQEKPEFPDFDDDFEIENWDEWNGSNQQPDEELHCEDPGFNMDCDYDPTKKKELQKELIENSRSRKKRRKSKFAEALARKKPVFDPKDKTFEQYVDEYYALDYEDLIGDIPCRFKYRKVVPNDFGLSIEEILNASDQELNRWVSLKRIVSRRPEHVELFDVKAYKKKAQNFNKKRKCFPSLYEPKVDHEEQNISIGNDDTATHGNNNGEYLNRIELEAPFNSTEEGDKKKKRKKKKKIGINDDRTEGFKKRDATEIKINAEFSKELETVKKKKGEESKVLENHKSNEITEYSKTIENAKPFKNDLGNDSARSKKKKRRKKKSKSEEIEESSNSKGKFMNSEEFVDQNSRGNSNKRKYNSLGTSGSNPEVNSKESKTYKKRKFIGNFQRENENSCNISDERLRSYGINPKKYKNKLKYKNKNK